MKPNSLMRRIEAFFLAAPDEELTMDDVRTKFDCTHAAAVQAVRHLRMEGMCLRFRFGRQPVLRLNPNARRVQTRDPNARRVQIVVRVAATPFQGVAEVAHVASDAVASPRIVQRTDGAVRVTRIAESETAEWQEREKARRARQRPPKPVSKARTRGKKLLELIGGDDGNEG